MESAFLLLFLEFIFSVVYMEEESTRGEEPKSAGADGVLHAKVAPDIRDGKRPSRSSPREEAVPESVSSVITRIPTWVVTFRYWKVPDLRNYPWPKFRPGREIEATILRSVMNFVHINYHGRRGHRLDRLWWPHQTPVNDKTAPMDTWGQGKAASWGIAATEQRKGPHALFNLYFKIQSFTNYLCWYSTCLLCILRNG